MTSMPSGFQRSDAAEPHPSRTLAIASQHPEIRQLNGGNAWTIFPAVGLVTVQLSVAFWIVGKPWWVFLLIAYTIGAVASHALLVVIHESSHNLIVKRKFANIPGVLPYSVTFKNYHLVHLSMTRILRIKEVRKVDGYVVLNVVLIMATNALLWFLAGPMAVAYLLTSFFFSAGIHPVGARWIQRHYLMEKGSDQETFSYYGPMNVFAFNVGYHNEHHDFPRVPWNKLPQIRQAAPEYYDDLLAHQSWGRLFYRFIFDRNLDLFARIVRDGNEPIRSTVELEQSDVYEGVGTS